MRPWILFLAACTQDFGTFEPKSDGSAPDSGFMDAMMGVDSSAMDSGTDADAMVAMDAGPCAGVTFNGHCYFLVASGTQTATRTACQNAGGHLATFGSAAEQTATLALGTPDWWIGLYRNGGPPKDGNYDWITNEPRTYTNWGANEPNGTGQCVRIQSDATWNDEDCTQSKQGLCERP